MTERIGPAVRVGVAVAALAVVAVATAASGVRADQMVTWSSERSVYRVVDVAGPRSDGGLGLAGGGPLPVFRAAGGRDRAVPVVDRAVRDEPEARALHHRRGGRAAHAGRALL